MRIHGATPEWVEEFDKKQGYDHGDLDKKIDLPDSWSVPDFSRALKKLGLRSPEPDQ